MKIKGEKKITFSLGTFFPSEDVVVCLIPCIVSPLQASTLILGSSEEEEEEERRPPFSLEPERVAKGVREIEKRWKSVQER